MTEPDFDPAELAAAERLDAEISATLAGDPAPDTDPAALWLATTLRRPAPRTLRQRLAAAVRPAPASQRWARATAAVLAMVLFWHGLSGQLFGDWIARSLGEPYGPHAYFEGGWAMMAVALVVGAGALRRRWLPMSVTGGVPLGVMLGAGGVAELGVFPAGAVLHLLEGALAIVLFATWFAVWRRGVSSHRAPGRS